jgi:signal transduction histidine kinase
LAERSDIQLGHALAAGLPPVLADERALRQILLNLLSTALRHTPAGGEISVTTAYRVDGPVRIEVRDTGPGISSEDLAAIEAEIDSERQGLPPPAGAGGLGLPLVCRLAQANGAEIGIDSKPGRGTRVFLTFARERVAQGTV